jgi:hypothetical protein
MQDGTIADRHSTSRAPGRVLLATLLAVLLLGCGDRPTAEQARVDANGNGQISKVEAEAPIVEVIEGKRKLFSICDRSNDGQFNNQEKDLAFNLLRAIAGD